MLWFWVIVLVVLIGAVAVVASGRGDAMADVYEDRPDVGLPTGRHLTADDLQAIRFNTGVRGYRMDEVDALLVRLRAELLERDSAEVRPVDPDAPESEPAPQPEREPASEPEPEPEPEFESESEAESESGSESESESEQTRMLDATSD